ncbi:MAG: hypothetical protein L6Q98_23305 [Anaerolineae bacterium]|nr:hypothetical protein [Anaerolineae bacterium]NUQ05724.1 hypothetical protein [Anaerolineae bacterium]
MRFQRRNLPWLVALGALIAIVLLSGTATGAAAAALLGLYAAAFFLSSVRLDVQPAQILDRSRASLAANRMSPEGREAVERARRRGSLYGGGVTLVDVGLIATQSGSDGIAMRRTRAASGDDDGIRPYITLQVQPHEADRAARVRFEMIDQGGETRYVHEMRAYLREGEVSVLADHHLPLATGEAQSGDWDLRVYVDSALVGIHAFAVSPSTRDRFAYLEAREAEAGKRLRASEDESLPVSLEDLLRSQRNSADGRSPK